MTNTTKGYYGTFGGQYVSELLIPVLKEMEDALEKFTHDEGFQQELKDLLKNYCGRPTPLYFAQNLSKELDCRVYLKREDLVHGGAHKTNNTVAQVLMAKRMGKKKIIAETGAGQHGTAVAMAGALFGMETIIFMGELDIERQASNVQRMKMCGATVIPVTTGSRTLKDAINGALRHWVGNSKDTFYVFGSVAGPHPFPAMVTQFQRIIGDEARYQILEAEGRLPDAIVACVGGGSNAIGIFKAFLKDEEVKLYGVEAAGKGLNTKEHAATLNRGSVGVLHGSESYVLQDEFGQIQEAHSVAPGLDYPGVGPEHSFLHDSGRVKYESVTDKEAIKAFFALSKLEGIIPAIESSHAVAYARQLSSQLKTEEVLIVNISGRGDKDLDQMQQYLT
jgi:tryptophan synthase beta chain